LGTAGEVSDGFIKKYQSVFPLGQQIKIWPDPDMASVLPQKIRRKLVKSAQAGPIISSLKQALHPLPHFGSRFVGECQG